MAPFCTKVHTKRSGMDHTVLPANNTMPAFPSWRSPDGAVANWGSRHRIAAYLPIYRPWRDERLSCPSWLTYCRWLTHISGHPSATSRAQDSKSTSAKDRCSTAGPRNQLTTPPTWDLYTFRRVTFRHSLAVFCLSTLICSAIWHLWLYCTSWYSEFWGILRSVQQGSSNKWATM